MTEKITFNFNNSKTTRIFLGQDICKQLAEILAPLLIKKTSRLLCISDNNVAPLYLSQIQQHLELANLDSYGLIIKAGESNKNLNNWQAILSKLANLGFGRQDFILALGGGMVSDLAGFAASCFMRGIGLILLPTSLIGQVDAAIGGKTAVNAPQAALSKGGKNYIGSFYPADYIFIDSSFLQTLSQRELRAAYSEIIKYGLINNSDFANYCMANHRAIIHPTTNSDFAIRDYAIKYCIEAKINLVEQDSLDQNLRNLLNLGHSFAHALEAFCNYDSSLLLHGEAVAIGIILACKFSCFLGICQAQLADKLEIHFAQIGLPTNLNSPAFAKLTAKSLCQLMLQDKKNSHSAINLILMRQMGKAFMAKNIPLSQLQTFLQQILDK